MKKCISLSLIILLCSCSGGKNKSPSGSTTKFYNPELSYKDIMEATEIGEDEFKEAVNANYVEPKSRYELMKCVLTSDGKIPHSYGGTPLDSLTTYFSLTNVPPKREDDPPRLFYVITDLEGTLLSWRGNSDYWTVYDMQDVHEWLSSGDVLKYYKSPFSIEYEREKDETVRIVFDDQFLPIQVERKTPNNEKVKVWHYDLSYFNPNDVGMGSGNVSEEAFAERYVKIYNNEITYNSYTVNIKGKYPYRHYEDSGEYSEIIFDYNDSFEGAMLVQHDWIKDKDYPRTLPYIEYEQLDRFLSDERYSIIAGTIDGGGEILNCTIPTFPYHNEIMYKYFDSPLRVEGYTFSQNENGEWKADYSFRRYYMEYNEVGLIRKMIYSCLSSDGKNTKCNLELTFSYR